MRGFKGGLCIYVYRCNEAWSGNDNAVMDLFCLEDFESLLFFSFSSLFSVDDISSMLARVLPPSRASTS